MSYQLVSDLHTPASSRLHASLASLATQQSVALDTLAVMRDTRSLMVDGHASLRGQTAKIEQISEYVVC